MAQLVSRKDWQIGEKIAWVLVLAKLFSMPWAVIFLPSITFSEVERYIGVLFHPYGVCARKAGRAHPYFIDKKGY